MVLYLALLHEVDMWVAGSWWVRGRCVFAHRLGAHRDGGGQFQTTLTQFWLISTVVRSQRQVLYSIKLKFQLKMF